jgi:creatinine amidohydrolase
MGSKKEKPKMDTSKSVSKSFILDMTWEEFRDAAQQSAVVVVPLGSIELEGSHLPLGVDTIVAKGISDNLSGQEGVIIGPIIPVGYSKWFNPFPGTISLENETLVGVLANYSDSLVRHGIRRIVFLNSHRGNNAAIEVVAHKLISENHIRVGMVNIWKLANDLTSGTGHVSEGKFTHAGEIMTSLVMALRPETVITEKIQPGKVKQIEGSKFEVKNSVGETALLGSIQLVYQDIRELTDSGTLGDPTKASAEKGQMIIELITDYLKAYLQEFRNIPPSLS